MRLHRNVHFGPHLLIASAALSLLATAACGSRSVLTDERLQVASEASTGTETEAREVDVQEDDVVVVVDPSRPRQQDRLRPERPNPRVIADPPSRPEPEPEPLTNEQARRLLNLPATPCGLTCAHLYASCGDESYRADCLQRCELERPNAAYLECCREETFSAETCEEELRVSGGVGVEDCDDSGRCSPEMGENEPPVVLPPGIEPTDIGPLVGQACDALCNYLGNQCGESYLRPDCVSECIGIAAEQGSNFVNVAVCCAERTFSRAECEQQGRGGLGVEDCDLNASGCFF